MMVAKQVKEFSKYERARIIGSRALQLAMNAPLLIKMSDEDLERVHYDVLKIAEVELDSGVLPISVNEPLPQRRESALKRPPVQKVSDKKVQAAEEEEEEKIEEEGEIMKLANPDDEEDESQGSEDREI